MKHLALICSCSYLRRRFYRQLGQNLQCKGVVPITTSIEGSKVCLEYDIFHYPGRTLVIISDKLSHEEPHKLVITLDMYRSIIGYSLKDLKRISPSLCTHHIPMDQDNNPIQQHQQMMNNVMREVVKKEVLKLLKAGVIYPVSDSEWVSPVQVVPKKGRMIVVHNEKNELIP
jgi:hypothetical protein